MIKSISVDYKKKESNNQVFLDSYLISEGAKELSNKMLGDVRSVRYGVSLLGVTAEEVVQHINENYPEMETNFEEGGDDSLDPEVGFILTVKE